MKRSDLNATLRHYGRATTDYKVLSRRIFRPHGKYADYKKICEDISVHLMTIPEGMSFGKDRDPTWGAAIHVFWKALCDPTFPVYALTEELVGEFFLTDPPCKLWGINAPFKQALILFPQGKILNPDGKSLDWVFVDFLEPWEEMKDLDEYSAFLSDRTGQNIRVLPEAYTGVDKHRLRWVASVGLDYLYSSTRHIPSPEDKEAIKGFVTFSDCDDANEEQIFTGQVSSLLFQTLLYMLRPRSQVSVANPTMGFAKHKKRSYLNLAKDYIWVGRDLPPRKPHQGGTHNSPIGHPRRGHYRQINADNQVWVRPTWVGEK
jgi:hypothetical protein